MTGVRVCGWGELDDGAARRVIVDGRPVALVRLGDRVHAIDDTCSHAEVSLAEGEVDAEECALECWKHGSLFYLETGEALTLPAVYSGLIRVRPEAVRTSAHQTNRNVKLSPNAWAKSVPNLEIETDDVVCSHASTVSPVDEDQRFFLESRGIPTGVAERLLLEGFFEDVAAAAPHPAVAETLREALAERLDRRTAGEEDAS